MNVTVTGHHLDVTPAIRNYILEKLERIERHFSRVNQAHVTIEVQRQVQKAEATLHLRGGSLHAGAEAEDMYAAIDALADKLDRLVMKRRQKVRDHHNREGSHRVVHTPVEAT